MILQSIAKFALCQFSLAKRRFSASFGAVGHRVKSFHKV